MNTIELSKLLEIVDGISKIEKLTPGEIKIAIRYKDTFHMGLRLCEKLFCEYYTKENKNESICE